MWVGATLPQFFFISGGHRRTTDLNGVPLVLTGGQEIVFRPLNGVHWGTTNGQCPVNMRDDALARGAYCSDDFVTSDGVTRLYGDGFQMVVAGRYTMPVIDDDCIAKQDLMAG